MINYDEKLDEVNDDYDIEQRELEKEMNLRDDRSKLAEAFRSMDHDDFREQIEFAKLDNEDIEKDEKAFKKANSTNYAKRMDWGIKQQNMLREIKQEAEEREKMGLNY